MPPFGDPLGANLSTITNQTEAKESHFCSQMDSSINDYMAFFTLVSVD